MIDAQLDSLIGTTKSTQTKVIAIHSALAAIQTSLDAMAASLAAIAKNTAPPGKDAK